MNRRAVALRRACCAGLGPQPSCGLPLMGERVSPVSVWQILAACAVMYVAATVQGSVGFGQNLLAAPMLLQIDESLVPAPIMIAAVLTNTTLFVRERGHVDLNLSLPAIIGRVPGSLVGAVVVAAVSAKVLGLVVAVAVFAVVLLSAFGPESNRSRTVLGGAGLLSGFTGTTTSIGGPFVGLAMAGVPGPVLRSSMGLYFMSGSAVSLAALTISGVLDGAALRIGALLLVPVALGVWSSRWFVPILDRGYTRQAILTLSTIAAVLLVIRLLLL